MSTVQRSSSTEEEIMKMRLLIDGDGRGDTKKFQDFVQDYTRWAISNNVNPSDDAETREMKRKANEIGMKRLFRQLNHLRFITSKTAINISHIESMKEEYEQLQDEIRVEITSHRIRINEIRENSEKERRLKEKKQEFETMLKLVNRLPQRKKKQAELQKLKDDLEQLQIEKRDLEIKMHHQKEKLAVLIQSAQDLSDSMKRESNGRPEMTTAEAMETLKIHTDPQINEPSLTLDPMEYGPLPLIPQNPGPSSAVNVTEVSGDAQANTQISETDTEILELEAKELSQDAATDLELPPLLGFCGNVSPGTLEVGVSNCAEDDLMIGLYDNIIEPPPKKCKIPEAYNVNSADNSEGDNVTSGEPVSVQLGEKEDFKDLMTFHYELIASDNEDSDVETSPRDSGSKQNQSDDEEMARELQDGQALMDTNKEDTTTVNVSMPMEEDSLGWTPANKNESEDSDADSVDTDKDFDKDLEADITSIPPSPTLLDDEESQHMDFELNCSLDKEDLNGSKSDDEEEEKDNDSQSFKRQIRSRNSLEDISASSLDLEEESLPEFQN